MSEKKVELKNCPFCGGDAVLERRKHSDWPIRVMCDGCKICTAWFIDYAEKIAVQRWNTRDATELDRLTAEVEAAKQLLTLANDEFNQLTDREKWDEWRANKKSYKGNFSCPGCGNKSDPEKCQPFPGHTMHCGNCEYELSRRTGGGQNDPFRWVLEIAVLEALNTTTEREKVLIEALEHYANKDHWNCSTQHVHNMDDPECCADSYNQEGNGYDMATEALAAVKELGEK